MKCFIAGMLVAVGIAACGGGSSGSSDTHKVYNDAVATCGRNGASKSSCTCAVKYAQARGDLVKLDRKINSRDKDYAKAVLNDPVAIQAGFACGSQ